MKHYKIRQLINIFALNPCASYLSWFIRVVFSFFVTLVHRRRSQVGGARRLQSYEVGSGAIYVTVPSGCWITNKFHQYCSNRWILVGWVSIKIVLSMTQYLLWDNYRRCRNLQEPVNAVAQINTALCRRNI